MDDFGHFIKWFQRWDRELNKTKKAIILVLDNCTTHPNVSLKNIKLEYLPPNITSLIQPLDMGVIQYLKVKYRETLVNYILEKIEENLLQPKSAAIHISKKINILQAIQFILDSWRDVRCKPSDDKKLFSQVWFFLRKSYHQSTIRTEFRRILYLMSTE